MAIASASRGTPLASGTDQNSYTMVDGGTPSNGILLLAFFIVGGVPPATSFTGYAQTWTLVGRDASSELELYACITASADSTAPVVTKTSATGINLAVLEVTGAYVSGTVLDAFEQQTAGVYIAEATDQTGTATSLSVTLKSPDNVLNRPFSAFLHNIAQVKAPRTNWTETADINHANPAKGTDTQYRSDAHETTASATWITAANAKGLAWTIRDATAPPAGASTEQFFPVVVGA